MVLNFYLLFSIRMNAWCRDFGERQINALPTSPVFYSNNYHKKINFAEI